MSREIEYSFVLYNPYKKEDGTDFFYPKKDNADEYNKANIEKKYFNEETLTYTTLSNLCDKGFKPVSQVSQDEYAYNIACLTYTKVVGEDRFEPKLVIIENLLGGGASKKVIASMSALPHRKISEKYAPSLSDEEFLEFINKSVKSKLELWQKKEAESAKLAKEGKLNKPAGGVVVRSLPKKKGEIEISYLEKAQHNLVLGATGSGKSQSIIIPSILSIGTSNASMVVNDPKGELYAKTSPFLKKMGYHVYVLDYLKPESGMCFNQLFLVNEEYKRGLPHYWANIACKELIKMFKIIQNGGKQEKGYELKYFREDSTSFTGSKLPPDLAKYEGDTSRCVKLGAGKNGTYDIYYIKPCGNLDTSVLGELSNLSSKEAISLIREILANSYDQVQKLAEKEKTGSFTDIIYGNNKLKIKQERTIQAAIDILNILSAENVSKYYDAKTKYYENIIEESKQYIDEEEKKKYQESGDEVESSLSSEQLEMCHEKITDFAQKKMNVIEDGELTIDEIIEFLEDSAHDHQIIWKEAESNASSLAGNIAVMVASDDGIGGDKFWTNTAKAVIQALILLVSREAENDNQKHFGSVQNVLSSSSEMGKDDKTDIDRVLNIFDETDIIRTAAYSERIAGDKTKTSIFSSTGEKTSIFSKPPVIDQCSRSDFDPEELVNNKTAIFLIAPGTDDSGNAQYALLSTLFIEQAYSRLNMLLNKTADQTCKRPVYFLIDECANIPSIPNLQDKVTLARSKNIRWTLCFQSFEQIKSKYKEGYATIKENTNCYYLLTTSLDTAKEISDRMGDETIEINSYSTSSNDKGTNSSTNTSTTGRKLMTPQEVMQLKESEALYLMQRQQPYKTHLEMAYKWAIYPWIEQHKVQNVHKSRETSDYGFFRLEWQDLNAAYELANQACLLDDMIFSIFKSIKA